MSQENWQGLDSSIASHIEAENQGRLQAYSKKPADILEHANIERATAQGGYGRRQIYELVQNGADALAGFPDGRIEVVLTRDTLYCANEGEPITVDGVDTILASHVSKKRGTEIGRFGLGFKSVLGVTDRPEFYSRSGSFGFDPAISGPLILGIAPHAQKLPKLRIAQPLCPDARAAADPQLRALMGRSSTIVKLPLTRGLDWLPLDLREFPAEFLLFSPHVGTLVMEDLSQGAAPTNTPANAHRRQIEAAVEAEKSGVGERVVLKVDDEPQEWTVFKTLHRPSDEAKEDGGELADRDELPIMWAVPRGEKERVTRNFWAFFPTENRSTLSGILNAPWKTNEDRQNVLVSRFNDELLDAAAKLVVENVPYLLPADEPGRYLELLPSLNDPPNEADRILCRAIYERLVEVPCLPDQNGILRRVDEVKLHPPVAREALEIWASYPKRPLDWVHASIERQHTRARALHLMKLGGVGAQNLRCWLEELVVSRSLNACAVALRAAAAALQADPKLREAISDCAIVKMRDGSLAPPQPGTLFLARSDGSTPANSSLALVHPDLASRQELQEVWPILGISEVEQTSQLNAILVKIAGATEYGLSVMPWEAFWKMVRGVPAQTALELMRQHIVNPALQLRVKSRRDVWKPLGMMLLPGAVIDEEHAVEWNCLIDMAFHGADEAILKQFGATDRPKPGCLSGSDEFLAAYRDEMIEEFYDSLEGEGRPQKSYLHFKGSSTTGPLDVYAQLQTAAAKERFCAQLLSHVWKEEFWVLRHDTRREYPPLECFPPAQWLLRTQGYLASSRGPWRCHLCLSPEFARWNALLPVARVAPDIAQKLRLKASFDEFKDDELKALLEEIEAGILECSRDTGLLSEYYAALAQRGITLSSVICRLGNAWTRKPCPEVWIESNADKIALIASDYPNNGHLFATTEQNRVLVEKWGLKRAAFNYEIVARRADEPTPLLDRFQGFHLLSERSPDLGLDEFELVPCVSLSRDTLLASGRQVKPQQFVREGKTLFYDENLQPEAVLERVVAHLDLPLDEEQQREIAAYQTARAGKAKLMQVRRAPTPAAKLLAALGARAIRSRLPAGLEASDKARLEAAGQLVADKDLRAAELALAVYGIDTLTEFRHEFGGAGLEPPSRWAGSHAARNWVKMLGFEPVYAGFEGATLSRLEEVDGPPDLPPAHDYQQTMMTAIRLLNAQDGSSKRGLLSLPTGAGKTRTAVEALVDAIREDGLTRATRGGVSSDGVSRDGVPRDSVSNNGISSDGALSDGALSDGALSDGALSDGALSDGALSDGASSTGAMGRPGPILWIAQSEELCEQAVVTWKWVWSAKGPRERLTISRLWSSNEADSVAPAPQVVVATIDKLQGVLEKPDYEWLSQAAFVVIDEAHHAISRQYTDVLKWLGLTWQDLKRGNDRCPLLGLTATAFRGSLEETQRLAKRFDSNRLDYEAWDDNPFPYLQGMGVLSRVRHEELETQASFRLSDAQKEYVEKFGVLPPEIERLLASSAGRNAAIAEAIRQQPFDAPILLFATSVAHAQTMAALLQTEGISAAAISGATPAATRRHSIQEFRAGRLRVLTNYGVLTTGFDAPSVRCVIIARPTYSPVLYQQMIGRGLRGPKNGGKAECVIIDVKDNISNYHQDLAFTEFEYLWEPEKLRSISPERLAEIEDEPLQEDEEIAVAPDVSIANASMSAEPTIAAPVAAPMPVVSSVISAVDAEAQRLQSKRDGYARGVKDYCGELSRRWARLAMPLGKVLDEHLKRLDEIEEKDLKSWQDAGFDALKKEAIVRGIGEKKLPWPRS